MPNPPISMIAYLDPTKIHRDLAPDRLAEAARIQAQTYAIKRPEQRTYGDAMVTGALSGAAFSRKYTNFMSKPLEVVFGAGLTPPSLTSGIIPQMAEAYNALFEIAVFPRLAPGAKTCAKGLYDLVNRYVHRPQFIVEREKNAISQVAAGVPLLFYAPLGGCIHASQTGSQWVSAAAKIAWASPGAIFGAGFGALYHYALGRRSESVAVYGQRGARNEETFILYEPVSQIPQGFFFLTSDRFGLDLRELRLFADERGSLINPYTNAPFSAEDLERLSEHPSGIFSKAVQQKMLRGATLLPDAFWAKYLHFFLEVSRALTAEGNGAPEHRRRAVDALRQVFEQGNPVESLILRLFFETLCSWPSDKILQAAQNNERDAYEIGARLYQMSLTVGVVQYAKNRSELREIVASVMEPPEARLSSFWEGMEEIAQLCLRYQQYKLIQRYPWLEKIYASNEVWPDFRTLGPFDLSVPTPDPWPEDRLLFDVQDPQVAQGEGAPQEDDAIA